MDARYIDTTDYGPDDWDIILEPVHKDRKDCDLGRKIHLSARNITGEHRFLRLDEKTDTVSATGTGTPDDKDAFWRCDRWSDSSLQFITAEHSPKYIMYISDWQLLARKRDKKVDDNDDQTKFMPNFQKYDADHCTLESKGTPGCFLQFDDKGRFKDQKNDNTNTDDKAKLTFKILK